MKIEIEIPENLVPLIEYSAHVWSGPQRTALTNAVSEFAADSLALQVYFEMEQSRRLEYIEEAFGPEVESDLAQDQVQDYLRNFLVDAQAPKEVEVVS